MRYAATLLLCTLTACASSPHPAVKEAQDAGANGAMWGTDAHLAPSRPDAILRYADHARGFAEVRMPEGEGPFPLAVIFHGGCFKYGVADQAYMSPLATSWQRRGVATLNVDYREVGDGGGWPGSFGDWLAAAQLIDEVAARYPIDRDRVTLVGHSAGALPALWLAEEQGPEAPGGARGPIKARAALILDGPGDLGRELGAFDALCQFSSVAPFMGGAPTDEAARYAVISPVANPPDVERVLFVNAALPQPPTDVVKAVSGRGAKVIVLDKKGNSHFSMITPGTPFFADLEPEILNLLKGD